MGQKLRTYVDLMAFHNEVTGSCNMLVIKFPTNEKVKILVDCGMFQELENEQYNKEFNFDPSSIDYVFVTHNHVDHTGKLPLLVRQGYTGSIYCSPATKTLMPLALKDSYKVLRDLSRRNNTKQLYSEQDVYETVAKLKPLDFENTIKIHRYIKATLFKNGHLLGAACILLQIQYEDEEVINLFFTGDFNNKNVFFDVPDIPKWVTDLPLSIVQESTYGNMDSSEITYHFKEDISKKASEGGTIVIPVFSLGRSQEILKVLKDMQEEELLDKSIPIYLDGNLAIKYTNIYLMDGFGMNDSYLDFLPTNFAYVDEDIRTKLMDKSTCKIIVTTSGSGNYGPAPLYFQNYIDDKDTLFYFTGFLFEGSLGRKLKETADGDMVKIGGIIFKKRADINFTSEFSAHAKADEMIDFLKKFKNVQAILVNHGEPEVKDIFAERISNEVDTKNVAVLDRNYFFRLSPWGIAKSVSTKFH